MGEVLDQLQQRSGEGGKKNLASAQNSHIERTKGEFQEASVLAPFKTDRRARLGSMGREAQECPLKLTQTGSV